MAREIERRGARLQVAAREAVDETLDAAHDLAYVYSSGPYSSADLARMDHPYARRHGEPQRDPSLINVQSGDFRSAWMIERARPSNGGYVGSLWNASVHAEKLAQGTQFMFERPIADRVSIEIEPVFQEKVERKMSEVLHG